MKKIYSKFCRLCRALVLLLLLAALIPNNLSAQTVGVPQTKDTTLVAPGPGHGGPGHDKDTSTWSAPLGAYQITNISIAGDGGDAGKGEKDNKGGDGGGGALIIDNNVYTLSSSSLRSLQYVYKKGDKKDDGRTVIFNSNTYKAGNGGKGGDAKKPKPNQGELGADGTSGTPGKCTLTFAVRPDNIETTDGGANNGGIGDYGGQGGPGPGGKTDKGQPGYVKITYTTLEIPVQIVKEEGVRDTSILYYDQIGHILNAADSANVEKYFYDEDQTRPVLGTDLCLANADSTVRLFASSNSTSFIFSVRDGSTDTVGHPSLKAAIEALNESEHGGTILVCADDSIADQIRIEKPMTIKAFGGNYTIKVANSFNADKALFTVYNNNEELILGEDDAEYTLTFDGNRKTPSAAFFYCSNISNGHPSLTIKDGVHITNCSSTVAYVTSGFNLNITGAVLIDNCTSDHLFYSSFPSEVKMTNGKIEDNTVTTCIFEIKGNAQMSGGAIQNNTYTGGNASAIISYYSHLDGYTDNSNVKLRDSIFIGDTVRLIAGSNFRDQLETVNELTKHSADNPIVVKVDYTEDRQILTGDAAYILANYKKFKPVDVNDKNVCIDKEGWLREYKFFSIATGTTDTVGHFTLKAAVDTLNNHGGGKVLADYGEVLTETVNVNSDIQILARDRDVTFNRGELLTNKPMITIAEDVVLSINVAEDVDTLAFDGGSFEVSKPIVLNNGTLNLLGNVVFRNNNSNKKGGAIVNNDSIYVKGNVLFQNNHTTGNGAGIYNDGGDESDGALFIKGQVRFTGNKADGKGGAIYVQNGRMTVDSDASLVFENNESKLGTVFSGTKADISIQGKAEFHNNIAENGTSIYVNSGAVSVNGYTVIIGDTATQGAIIYNRSNLYFNTGLVTGNVCRNSTDSIINGIISANGSKTYLRGGHIFNNKFDMTSELDYNPYTAVLTSKNAQLSLGDSISIDTVRLYLKDGYSQKINILSDLTAATASNPIVLVLDSLDKKVLRAEDGTTLVADNYVKFKPSSDTLAINNKGYAVRKPEISIDTVYLLQAGTDYADYGITSATGNIEADALYVVYTQNVDAHGRSNTTKADSLVLNMSVGYNGGTPVALNEKLSNNVNSNTTIQIPFPATLSDGALKRGSYAITANADVYTLGLKASTEYSQNSDIYIPTFEIDTLNFLLAGTKFSDYGHCGVGASTNDGLGADIIPNDEIYVGYQRAEGGNVDSAYIKVTLTDADGTSYIYEEGTVSGQILEPGCGHFRQFTNSTKWTPALNLSDDFDGKDFSYTINIYQRTQDEPYFATAIKTGTYHHEIDRECTIALANATECAAMGIRFTVNDANETITLTYPNYFDKNAVPQAMKQDGVIKVGISFDPQDPTITMAWFDDATDITTTDGKYIVWIPISKAISSSNPLVEAENYASTDDTIRLSSTDVKGVYRKTFNVEGALANVDTSCANVTYHTTGASGVVLKKGNNQYRYTLKYDNNDYTVWNVQDPESFGKSADSVYAALYVNRPADTLNRVYISNMMDSVEMLTEDKLHQLTDSAFVHYVALGYCANQATKDYTFDASKSSDKHLRLPKASNSYFYVYWFKDDKFVKAEKYFIRRQYAPTYTVDFNFHGGGATCNTPYSDTFADTTYVFGRPIVRPDDPFKCGHLFMDWRHGVDSFTVDSFKNIRAGIAEGTGTTVEAEPFGIRSDLVLDAAWKYFVTIEGLRDTAIVANYSLCEINTRDYVVEPTEAKRPYIYTYHTDYLGKYYRDYLSTGNANCDVRFDDSTYLETPLTLPVGQTSQVTWTVTDMCGTPFTLTQNVNVMFPPCGADNYDPAESAYVSATNNHGSLDGEYLANIDGKDYRTVRIGCNCWLKENLQNDQYANGDNIAIAKAYFDDESKVAEFGRLYTWYSAVNVPEGDDVTQPATANETITFDQTAHTYSRDYVQGVCPDGWHIPAIGEYQNLKDVVGSSNAVKAVDGSYWLGYQDATDAAGFTGVPGGYYDNSIDRYFNILGKAYFWSTENYGVKALPCSLLYGCPEILFNEQNKFYGVSVRCVRNIKISY